MNKHIIFILLLLPLSVLAGTNSAQGSAEKNKVFLENFKRTSAKGFCNAEGIQRCWNFNKNSSCTAQVEANLNSCFDEILGTDLYINAKQRLRKSHKHLLFCMMEPYTRKSNEIKTQSKEVACSKIRNSLMEWKTNTFIPLLR